MPTGRPPPEDPSYASMLDAFFDNTQEFLGVIEILDEQMDLRYVRVNRAAARYVSVPAEALEGKLASEIGVTEDTRRIWIEHCRESARTNAPVKFEYRRQLPDGTHTLSATTFKISSSHFCFVIDDVTESQRARVALQDSESRFRAIFESTTSCMIVLADRVMKYLNQATLSTFGYTEEEMVGNSTALLHVTPESFETAGQEAYAALQACGHWSGEVQLRKKNGDIIWMDCRLSTLPDVGVIAVLNDTTERRRAEAERQALEVRLARAQKMEAIGTLAGGVAHDLNNILSALVTYPEVLLLDLPDDHPIRPDILAIQDSGARAAAIVQDLLTLARRGVVQTDVVCLNDVVTSYLASLEHGSLKASNPGCRFKIEMQQDLLNTLASSVHLSKSLSNLVDNAVEALPNGGCVTISTRNQYVDSPVGGYDDVKEGDYVVISVADNGVGISAANMGKIFEPFYTTKVMARSGTGLGMAVVWGAVKDHSGYIDVRSTESEGTTFELYFPVTRKGAVTRVPAAPEKYVGKGELILVVDDVEEQRRIATALLIRLGYVVEAVSSGEMALEFLAKRPAHLVILDMIMDPGMDGLDTYKKMLELPVTPSVIIASGYAETARIHEALRLGAALNVQKPYTMERMGLAVKAALQADA